MSSQRILELLVLASLGTIAGCGTPMIAAEDVVVTPGQTARFTVSIDREYLKPSVVGTDVSFFINRKLIGEATGDADGTAVVFANITNNASSYQARSTIDGHTVKGNGRIFHWDTHRTAVAVDVDDTISRTDYGDLFLGRFDITSVPLDYAPQALQVMARSYHIAYVSARPRWLHEKTKVWLERNGFPVSAHQHHRRLGRAQG